MAKGGSPYHAVNRTGDSAEPVESGNSLLANWSITKRQSHNWQGLGEIDDETFERAVTQPGASTTGILAEAKPKERHAIDLVSDDALWIWGTLERFRLDVDPAHICDSRICAKPSAT
jgi:hypothetical protein